MSGITNVQGTVVIFLNNIATLISSYNKLVVYKSVNGSTGTFSPITTTALAAAYLISENKQLYSLNGLTLTFKCNGVVKSVTFGAQTTAAAVAAKIQADTGVTAAAYGDYVKLTSTTTGLNSTLEIHESSEGGAELGFYNEAWAIGTIAYLILDVAVKTYTIVDPNSSSAFWFRYRLYNSITGIYSEYSAPFQARSYQGITTANLIFGTLQLMDSAGQPIVGKMVKITMKEITEVENRVIDGDTIRYYTDSAGQIAIPLIKGSKIVASVEDTHVVREITVPSTGESFNLFAPLTGHYDSFSIATYALQDMERVAF
jgi:hypothetical protein